MELPLGSQLGAQRPTGSDIGMRVMDPLSARW